MGPALTGAYVISKRGGDFELTIGQDVSIGYDSHTADVVNLYFIESFTFLVYTPEAAVALTWPPGNGTFVNLLRTLGRAVPSAQC